MSVRRSNKWFRRRLSPRSGYSTSNVSAFINGSSLTGIKIVHDGSVNSTDYDAIVHELSLRCRDTGTRLRFSAFFAEKDSFIGQQGMEYFNDVFSSPVAQQGFDYECEVVNATDHEGIGYPEIGVVGRIMDALVASGPLVR